MARTAMLRKRTVGKHVYWTTSAGGRCIYFGNVNNVTQAEAQKAFNAYLEGLNRPQGPMQFVKIIWETKGDSNAQTSKARQS